MKKRLLLFFVLIFLFKCDKKEEIKENYIKAFTNFIHNYIESIKKKYPDFYEKEGKLFSSIAENIKKLNVTKTVEEKQEIIFDILQTFKEKIKTLVPEEDLSEINSAIEFINHFIESRKNNYHPDKPSSEKNQENDSHQKDYNKTHQNEMESEINNPYSINSNAIDKKMFIVFIVFIIFLCLIGSYIIAKRRVKQSNIEKFEITPKSQDSEANLEIPQISSIVQRSFIPKDYANITQLSTEQKLDE